MKETNGGATVEQEPQPQAAAPQTAQELATTAKALEELGLQPGKSATPVPVRMGLMPTTIEEGWRLAQIFAKSELVPKNFQGKAGDVLVAMQMGIEIGFPPMQALQSIAVINGRPSVWGDGFLALLMSSPLYADHDERYEVDGEETDRVTADDLKKPGTAAVCTFWRRGKTKPVTRRFTIAQARAAGLLDKIGPWKQYPERMLQMRARSWAGRDAFPDLLRGIRTAEEAIDTPEEDAIDATPPREVRRISEAAKVENKSAETPAIPAAEDVVIDSTIKTIEQFLGGFVITLGNGVTVDCLEAADAMALESFRGTPHKVRLTCKKREGALELVSFKNAD